MAARAAPLRASGLREIVQESAACFSEHTSASIFLFGAEPDELARKKNRRS